MIEANLPWENILANSKRKADVKRNKHRREIENKINHPMIHLKKKTKSLSKGRSVVFILSYKYSMVSFLFISSLK